MSDQVINLVLRYRDQGSANAKRAMDAITKGMSDTGRAAQGAAQQAMRVHDQLRKVTGLRPSAALPRWFREIGNAADQTATRVQRLTQNMGKFVTSWGQGAAGVAAGAAVFAGPVRKTMGYDTQLRGVVNTAYAGQSLDVRRARMATINDAVMAAVRAGKGGATREDALAAIQALTGSNEYKDPRDALAALPSITRAAAANNSSSTDFAKIALAARQTLGLKDTDRVLNMATRAGQLGGFEIGDMAKALPAQLAGAQNAGLSGYEGYASLLALNQAARTTAGSTDEGANNVVNLLGKLTSPDTAADFKKAGIDQTGELLKAQKNGTNVLEAFGGIIENMIKGDPRYAELSKKAASAKGDEEKALYGSMAQIVEGAGIGKVLQDRQALMAFLGYRNQREKYAADKPLILSPGDANGENLRFMAESAAYESALAAEEAADRMQAAMNKVNPMLGGMAASLTGIMQEFPVFSSSVIAASIALTGLAAAAGVVTGVGVLTGGRGTAAAAGAGAAAAATAGKLRTARLLAGGLPISAWLGSAGSFAAAAGGVAGAGLLGYGFGTLLNDKAISGTATGDAVGEAVARLMAFFGSDEARQAVDVNIRLENGNLVAEVNEKNGREALRK